MLSDFRSAMDSVIKRKLGDVLERKYLYFIGKCHYDLSEFSDSLSIAMKLAESDPKNTDYSSLAKESINQMNEIEKKRHGGEHKSYFVIIDGKLKLIQI